MASNKSTLDAPDAFQVQAYSAMDRLAKNQKPLAIGGGVILALLIGGYAVKYIREAKDEKLATAASEVDRVYEGELTKYRDQLDVLQKQKDALVAKQPSVAPGQPPVETPEVKAINDQLSNLKPDHAASSAKYLEFYKANPKSAEGLAAGLKHAAYLSEKGDLDGAKGVLATVAADSKSEKVLHVQSLFLLISIEEDKAEFDSAVKHSDDLIAAVGTELMPRALLTKSQVLFLKKDFPEAKKVLDKLISDHGTSPEAERARGLLSLLPA